MLPNHMESSTILAGLTSWLIVTIIAIMVPLFLLLQESLLTFWIMLVTLQLISHMALMSSMMPGEVILFLRTVLSLLRLQFTGLDKDGTEVLNPIFEMVGYN